MQNRQVTLIMGVLDAHNLQSFLDEIYATECDNTCHPTSGNQIAC